MTRPGPGSESPGEAEVATPTPPPRAPAPLTRPRARRATAALARPAPSSPGSSLRPIDTANDLLAIEMSPHSVRVVARGAVAWALAGAAIGLLAVLAAPSLAQPSRRP